MPNQVDVVILGSGFASSLLSMLLSRSGMQVAVVDRTAHPRFAIGESSTPLADSTLVDLAQQYDLPELMPLTALGIWRRTHPQIMCGPKRGFSYFGHTHNGQFSSGDQLLVAASADDEHSDTQWLRSDVDAHLFQLAAGRGATQYENADYRLAFSNEEWLVAGNSSQGDFSLSSPFVVDASGPAGEVLRHLKIPSDAHLLRTTSHAIYAHFDNVTPVSQMLDAQGIDRTQQPFDCDDAAVHHVLAEGWMWQLRFCDQSVSAGFVIGSQPEPPQLSPQQVWSERLSAYPFLQQQFENSRIIRPRTGLKVSPRLQRLTSQAADNHWAVLPSTAGFIDPLHSTGIAHSLFGIRRLASILSGCSSQPARSQELPAYSAQLIDELRWIDMLIEGCYAGLPSFRLWSGWCMLYFAAVTSMEQSAEAGGQSFLRADDPVFRGMLGDAREQLQNAMDRGRTQAACVQFEDWLRDAIQPWNQVGLLDRSCGGMYSRTAKNFTGPSQPDT